MISSSTLILYIHIHTCFTIHSVLYVFLFTNLFKVETNRTQKIKVMLLDGTLRFISTLIIPTFYYRAVNIVITITLFKIFFKADMELV